MQTCRGPHSFKTWLFSSGSARVDLHFTRKTTEGLQEEETAGTGARLHRPRGRAAERPSRIFLHEPGAARAAGELSSKQPELQHRERCCFNHGLLTESRWQRPRNTTQLTKLWQNNWAARRTAPSLYSWKRKLPSLGLPQQRRPSNTRLHKQSPSGRSDITLGWTCSGRLSRLRKRFLNPISKLFSHPLRAAN